MNKLFKLFLTS